MNWFFFALFELLSATFAVVFWNRVFNRTSSPKDAGREGL
jgi:hypothetical protein